MAESIIRLERRSGFTVLPTQMLRDPRLSLKTKGLFAVMLSLPERWEYSVSGLAHINQVGRDTIRTALKELEDAGYLTRERTHGAGGKFAGNVYIIREESSIPVPSSENPAMADLEPSSGFPTSDKPTPDKPSLENPPQSNIDRSSIDLIDPPKAPQGGPPDEKPKRRRRAAKSAPTWKPDRFEGFWAYYPRHEDRVSAVEEWDRLQPSDELIDTMGRALTHQLQTESWRAGIGIPYACRWLKKRRWEDVPYQGPAPTPPAVGGGGGRVIECEEVRPW